MEDTMNVRARKLDLDKRLDRFDSDRVAVEAPIRLSLNGKYLTTIMASPSNLKEMGVGFLVDEGIITSSKDILNMSLEGDEISIRSNKINQERFKLISENGVLFTSSRSRADFNREINELKATPITSNCHIDAKDVLEMVNETIRGATIFQSTGAVHCASVFVDNVLKGFAEDVSRHSAVDKAIGIGLTKNVPLEEATLITSGRQPAYIVFKAARCRIPISVSMKAPISSGVDAADLTGITLICFARNRRMNVYSHPERINPL